MKKSIKTLALAAGLLAAAGSVQAAPLEINIYGASAQFVFLTALADNILTSPKVGCTSGVKAGPTTIGSYYAVEYNPTAGSPSCVNGIRLRIANKSSSDGIKAVYGAAGGTCPAFQRQFINPGDAAAPAAGVNCYTVTLAASDVAPGTFSETSNGCEFGPVLNANKSCGVPTGKTCTNVGGLNNCYLENKKATPIAAAGAVIQNPMIVPFAFWANNTLKVNRCTDAANAGRLCDPGTGAPCAALANCVAKPLDNMSRIMASNIFGGAVLDMADFGTAYTSTNSIGIGTSINTCIRHAGSGTVATLDQAVMNAGKWGNPIITDNDPNCHPTKGGVANPAYPACMPRATGQDAPVTWFTSSSDDEMNCINSQQNGIGFVDADACNGNGSVAPYPPNTSPYVIPAQNAYGTNLCANVNMLAYNGSLPYRENVRNGSYDFFTIENLILNPATYAAGTDQAKFFANMISAIDPAFVNFAAVGDSSQYWATVGEMRFSKATDANYPATIGDVGSGIAPATPVLP